MPAERGLAADVQPLLITVECSPLRKLGIDTV